jgi:hypothetical protein
VTRGADHRTHFHAELVRLLDHEAGVAQARYIHRDFHIQYDLNLTLRKVACEHWWFGVCWRQVMSPPKGLGKFLIGWWNVSAHLLAFALLRYRHRQQSIHAKRLARKLARTCNPFRQLVWL